MPRVFIGIDPGVSGGLAILCDDREPETYKAPETIGDLWQVLMRLVESADKCQIVAVVERVHAGPKIGSSAAFKFGRGVGHIEMALYAAGIRLESVTPQKWQRAFGLIVKGRGLGQGDRDKKNRNKARAQELFPELKITHAIADALLLAEYGRRLWHSAATAGGQELGSGPATRTGSGR